MTHSKSSRLPSFSQLAKASLLWGASLSQSAAGQGASGSSLALATARRGLAGADLPLLPYRLSGGRQAALDRALALVDTDHFAESDGASLAPSRRLQQVVPGTPGVTPARPAAVATPSAAPANAGYIFVPDQFNYGACDSGINSTLARVNAAMNNGTQLIYLDVFASDRHQSLDLNPARLNDTLQVIDLVGRRGGSIIVGIAKDDVTMFTSGRPELDRVPTVTTGLSLQALANAASNRPHLALSAGGQPKNPTGSLTPEIANIYGNITELVRATGFTNNLLFKAPAGYGQNLSFYAAGNASYYAAQNIRFAVDLTSDGDMAKVNATIGQCNPLPCLIITGVQVNPKLKIFNTIGEVGRQLELASQRGVPTMLTPFADLAVQSHEGESVMLDGNICLTPDTPPTLSSTGAQLLALQRQATADSSAVG